MVKYLMICLLFKAFSNEAFPITNESNSYLKSLPFDADTLLQHSIREDEIVTDPENSHALNSKEISTNSDSESDMITLRGETGFEQVSLSGIEGDDKNYGTFTLTKKWQKFKIPGNGVRISFVEDNGDVFLSNPHSFDIEFLEERAHWNCGSVNANIRCIWVKEGRFHWQGNYILKTTTNDENDIEMPITYTPIPSAAIEEENPIAVSDDGGNDRESDMTTQRGKTGFELLSGLLG